MTHSADTVADGQFGTFRVRGMTPQRAQITLVIHDGIYFGNPGLTSVPMRFVPWEDVLDIEPLPSPSPVAALEAGNI